MWRSPEPRGPPIAGSARSDPSSRSGWPAAWELRSSSPTTPRSTPVTAWSTCPTGTPRPPIEVSRHIRAWQAYHSSSSRSHMATSIAEIVLAGPRGFCAGVERAIDIVELALEVCRPPVYVRREIVHNGYVVEKLRAKGAIFVDELNEVPDRATVIFSAHGVSPAVREDAARRGLRVIDATCPLVTKVHLEAIRYARENYSIILIGHEDHDEVIGTLGEAPRRIFVIDSVAEVEKLKVPNPEKIAYLTQTTLSVDDTRDVIEALRRRFPRIVGPSRDDICYATQNRQAAVKTVAGDVDVLLVIGAANSSNANRLVEVGKMAGTHAYLINDVSDIRPEWLAGASRIGITAGASTPEMPVAQAVDALRGRRVSGREGHVVEEDVRFAIPQELERMAQERGMALPERTEIGRAHV